MTLALAEEISRYKKSEEEGEEEEEKEGKIMNNSLRWIYFF